MYIAKKAFKFLNNNRLIILFLLITFLGVVLRIAMLLSKDIFTDEVFYTEVARLKSFLLIIQIHHWIKDHGQLYLIYLKIVQGLTTNIIFIRFSNLFLYIVLNFFLFKFFNKFQKGLISLFPVFLFSFLPFFVYLNSYVSPYNFVLFFSILAFIFISNFILFSKTKREKVINSSLFLLFSTLAFYSDYSVVYFYLSLMPLVFLVFIWSEKQAEDLVLIGFLNLILIIPGLYILSGNFQYFSGLNNQRNYLNNGLLVFVNNFANIIFFDLGKNVSLLIFVAFFILIGTILLKSRKDKSRIFLSFVFLSGILINITFLYIFNTSYFSIFTERTFWYFYFLLVVGLSVVAIYFKKFKKTFVLILILIVLFIAIKFINSYKIDPISRQNFNYKGLVSNLLSSKNLQHKNLIVFFDEHNTFRYVPLREYYFKALDSLDAKNALTVRNYFANQKIVLLESAKSINSIGIKNKETIIFIILDENGKNYLKFKNSLNTYEETKKIKTINIFYRLRCKDSDCQFYSSE